MPVQTARRSAIVKNVRVTKRRASKPSLVAVRPRDAKPDEGDPNKENDKDLRTKFMKLQEALSDVEEMADGIAQDLVMKPGPVQHPTPEAPEEHKQVRKRKSRVIDDKWLRAARPGVGDVSIGAVANGKVPVSIDGAKEFPLPPALADILAVLIEVEDAEDEFPPPRSIGELAKAYGIRRGRRETKQAVVVALGRLRHQLEMIGNVSPALVETVPGRGVRFRIRRDKP